MTNDPEPDTRQRLEEFSDSDKTSAVRDTITNLSTETGEEPSVRETPGASC